MFRKKTLQKIYSSLVAAFVKHRAVTCLTTVLVLTSGKYIGLNYKPSSVVKKTLPSNGNDKIKCFLHMIIIKFLIQFIEKVYDNITK